MHKVGAYRKRGISVESDGNLKDVFDTRTFLIPVGSISDLPAVRTSQPALDVRSSGLLCGWPDGLELANYNNNNN